MPNSETFSIKPIRELIDRYKKDGMVIVDPFARNSDIGTITNDLDPETKAMYHKDATDFLCHLDDNIADMVLYDPPYSARQVSESYKRLGGAVDMQTTQSSYWARQKKEIARITKKGGVVITCAWNSGGIGAGLGFEQQEILLVAHGGWHNDTPNRRDRGYRRAGGREVRHPPSPEPCRHDRAGGAGRGRRYLGASAVLSAYGRRIQAVSWYIIQIRE